MFPFGDSSIAMMRHKREPTNAQNFIWKCHYEIVYNLPSNSRACLSLQLTMLADKSPSCIHAQIINHSKKYRRPGKAISLEEKMLLQRLFCSKLTFHQLGCIENSVPFDVEL
ncbi:hypothetical protein CDAR_406041 [Caerostris darwini]|uniref:Uncharacterized protein n=1 Tax=Caerostris darwini TaxID=1538125 RepID=A0AAV4TSQ9_9ARAC|nr:hypothetical protein CDAR_406041 [Caerostris darwini]